MAPESGDQLPGVCGLILAAGRGTRFGGGKLLASYRGSPLLAHPAGLVAGAVAAGELSRGVVVIPPGEQALANLVTTLGLTIATNPDPRRGMASSLRIGLDACAGHPAVVVVLGDQPLVSREHLRTLLAAALDAPEAVVRPQYAGDSTSPGHPVVVPARHWPLLRGDEGDHGFGPLLGEGIPVRVVLLPGRNPDVDRSADLEALETGRAEPDTADA